MTFAFVLVSALLAYNTTFFKAEEILNSHIAADVTVEARSAALNKSVLGSGSAVLCGDIPQALAKCRDNTTDAIITLNSMYTPHLGTILHEVMHGLGLGHSNNKRSLMYARANGVDTLDEETLDNLQQLGYNVTSSAQIPTTPLALQCLLSGVLLSFLGTILFR